MASKTNEQAANSPAIPEGSSMTAGAGGVPTLLRDSQRLCARARAQVEGVARATSPEAPR